MSDQDKLRHEAGAAGATAAPESTVPEVVAEREGTAPAVAPAASEAASPDPDGASVTEVAPEFAGAAVDGADPDASQQDADAVTSVEVASQTPVEEPAAPETDLVDEGAEVESGVAVSADDVPAAADAASVEASVSSEEAADTEAAVAASAVDAPAEPVLADAGMLAETSSEVETPAEPSAPTVDAQLKAIIEALVFASPDPLTTKALGKVLEGESREAIDLAIESLKQDYGRAGGLQLVEVAGGFQIVTRPDLHEWVRRLFHERTTQKLSVAALETLAVIAYKQPITSAEIADVRGVNTSGVLGTLIDRKLVKIVGRKQVVGRPFMYATTREFLNRFGLRDLNDLPKVEDMADALGFDPPTLDDVATAAALPFDLDAPGTGADAVPPVPGDGNGDASGDGS